MRHWLGHMAAVCRFLEPMLAYQMFLPKGRPLLL